MGLRERRMSGRTGGVASAMPSSFCTLKLMDAAVIFLAAVLSYWPESVTVTDERSLNNSNADDGTSHQHSTGDISRSVGSNRCVTCAPLPTHPPPTPLLTFLVDLPFAARILRYNVYGNTVMDRQEFSCRCLVSSLLICST